MSRSKQENPLDTPAVASFRAGLLPVQQVLAECQARHNARKTIILPDAVSLNLHWVEPHSGMPRGGFMGRIDGKDLPLGETGMRTACKLIKSRPEFFEQLSDPDAFPKLFRNAIDNPNRQGDAGIMVRTGLSDNGFSDEIAAILPPSYEVRDAN